MLLTFGEVTTGFGHAGKLFTYERADAVPDVTCLGEALIGNCLTLSAAVTHKNIAGTVNDGTVGYFMHESTFIANPLACVMADESVKLLVEDG